jgi:cytochrome oxidase assembly protein ShyY1
LIARGWIARDVSDRTRLPPIATPAGRVEIQGMVRRQAGRLFQFGSAPQLRPGAIVQNAEVAEFATASQLKLKPFVIEQSTDTQDGLVRDWPRPSTGAEKHRGYAFQWYALAITAFLFFVVTGLRRETRQ